MRNYQNDPNLARFLKRLGQLEPVILGVVLLGFVGIMQNWGIPKSVFIVSTSMLALYYGLKGLSAVVASKNAIERWIPRLLYFALALGMIGFEFNLMNWPKWQSFAMLALTAIMISFMLLVLKRKAVTDYLNMYELSSMLLIMLYFGKEFYTTLQS